MKAQKGITLIALIITIIVMIILVAVTINVSLNGGLFDRASKASKDTQREADREELFSGVVSAYDATTGTLAENELKQALGTDKWTVVDNGDGTFLCTKISTGNVFKVEKTTAKIIDVAGENNEQTQNEQQNNQQEPENPQNPQEPVIPDTPISIDELSDYILGEDGEGRSLDEIWNMQTLIFKQDSENETSNIYQYVKYSNAKESITEGVMYDIYIRCKRDVYKFGITASGYEYDENTNSYNIKWASVADTLSKISTPEGNLGKYVTYNGLKWIVLTDDANKVELITANVIGEVYLGAEEGNATFGVARTSYNGAIATLVDECENETNISANIRNAGGPNTDGTTNTVVFANLSEFQPRSGVTFENYEGQTNGLKIGDNNYLTDYNKMEALGIVSADTPADYWLSSRNVNVEGNTVVKFKIRCVNKEAGLLEIAPRNELSQVNQFGYGYAYNETKGVRPIVTLSAGAFGNVAEGKGTNENPIEL